MIKIIKNIKVYTPDYVGIKDVLILAGKIGAIEDNIDITGNERVSIEIIDGVDKILVPGFIDSHVHILGGGGEGGFKTRTPEITLTDITTAGVTTVVGCLGTDGITRNIISLLAKATALEEEGISTYIYTGSYRIPVTTITGDIMKDLICIDKIIGVGEIAISDHRSSQPELTDLKKLVADARVSGILSGKAGVVNIHVGDGTRTIDMLLDIVSNTEIPYTQFIPTHMNRNPYLFEAAVNYGMAGGLIDFTTSSDPMFWEEGEVKASRALKLCLDAGVPISQITFTSDGQGSLPMFNEKKEYVGLRVGKVATLFEEVRDAILKDNVPMEDALKVITSNPATALKLRDKGRIAKGMDADLVILEETTLEIHSVIAKGIVMIKDNKIKVYGTFQNQV
jgi:beta-aspartyl-dipeptidase (metallo-type)